MTAGDVLSAALEALARADAEGLVRLAAEAREVPAPATMEERQRTRARHRTLGKLLRLTRHNLRLLRGVYGGPCGYGAPRD